ncbi:uncharacterized protein A4U43_C04F11560 [Asparagus officinalis]|uniref:Wax synthase domain-containing protein n=1 Tax=Asparagus officinalis TaxID=4686 RepID=A0A5P1F5F8_ASPOF|nr:uncharacterized protein A4U43_C04F11560 [Asparagus officinalis]
MYCLHIYLALDVVLASAAFLAGSLLGLDLEPQFDAPFKSTSLQEFWGRRWNLMVTGILRPSVYRPIRSRYGAAAGFMAVFLVSGLMHEVMFWYVTLGGPTGEVTLFFLIHGVHGGGGAGEEGWWWRPPLRRRACDAGFVWRRVYGLFFPPVLRGERESETIDECAAMVGFLKREVGDFPGG